MYADTTRDRLCDCSLWAFMRLRVGRDKDRDVAGPDCYSVDKQGTDRQHRCVVSIVRDPKTLAEPLRQRDSVL